MSVDTPPAGDSSVTGAPAAAPIRVIFVCTGNSARSLIAEVLAMGWLDEYVPEVNARVMDLCTGNGSLAVLAAMAWPQAMVHGLDLSPQALQVAARNVERHAMGERIDDPLAQRKIVIGRSLLPLERAFDEMRLRFLVGLQRGEKLLDDLDR